MTATQTDELYWDPYDLDLDDPPHATWRRMRDEAPVYRNDRYDFWALSRFEDVENAHKDVVTFSSAYGTVLEMMGPDMAGSGQIIFMDPPDHTMYRSLVSRAFTPRRMAALDDDVREICTDLLDGLSGRESFDYIQDFAAQVPSRVISRLVGVPDDEREEQRVNIDTMFHIDPERGMVNDVAFLARIRLHEYLVALVDRHRNDPDRFDDDLIKVLMDAEITDEDGVLRTLEEKELIEFIIVLFVAGTETVMRLLGNAAVLLAAHPEQRAELVADPSLLPNAIEECLRFEAPSPVQGRWLTRDIDLHGVHIPAGSKVLLLTGSADRDERAFPDADRFDIHREIKHHVAFGYGIHFCVGAALARQEGKIALEETLKRFPTWDIDWSGTVRQHTSTVRGYSEVGITVR
jgi:cytochrome P450